MMEFNEYEITYIGNLEARNPFSAASLTLSDIRNNPVFVVTNVITTKSYEVHVTGGTIKCPDCGVDINGPVTLGCDNCAIAND